MDKTWIDIIIVKTSAPDTVLILCFNYVAIVNTGFTEIENRECNKF